MKMSTIFLHTLKEEPRDAEVVSHKLMLRASMIKKLASGIYSYLPYGLKALRKVEKIIREEMNAAGAQEVLMPAVQPSEIWKESGRWSLYGKELLRVSDRKDAEFVIGPTHEEVITDIVRDEVHSYKDTPLEPVPDPDQVPRRDQAALRRHEGPRIHHEGCLFLR